MFKQPLDRQQSQWWFPYELVSSACLCWFAGLLHPGWHRDGGVARLHDISVCTADRGVHDMRYWRLLPSTPRH